MPIKFRLDNLEGLEPTIAALYSKADDGKYYAQVEGAVVVVKVDVREGVGGLPQSALVPRLGEGVVVVGVNVELLQPQTGLVSGPHTRLVRCG